MAFTDRLHNRGSIGGLFQIENSTLIDFTRNEYLTRTHVDGNRTTGAISVWVKRGRCDQTGYLWELGDTDSADGRLFARFQIDNRLRIATASTVLLETNRVFRDVSAWYHIVVTIDTGNGTGADRVRLYVNGVRETSFATNNAATSLNQNLGIGNGRTVVGRSQIDNAASFDGYLTEFNYMDGTAYEADHFGKFHQDGEWVPIDISTGWGTQGCRLEMQTASAPGDDTSGNGNDFTSSGLGTQDQATDTPTNNFCTWFYGNHLDGNENGFTGGNLLRQGGSSAYNTAWGTQWVSEGSWYWEMYNVLNAAGSGTPMEALVGMVTSSRYKVSNGNMQTAVYNDGTANYIAAMGPGATHTYGFHLDLTTSNPVLKIYKDGVLEYTKNSGLTKGDYFTPFCSAYNGELILNAGGAHLQDHGFSLSSPYQDENGYGNFKYQPPTGALALCTQNLATTAGAGNSDYTNIDDPSAHFQTFEYTGNATARSITLDGNSDLQPDLYWYKAKNVNYHYLVDSNRGTTKYLYPNDVLVEGTVASAYVTSFDSDGVSLGSGDSGTNTNGLGFANWVWKANGGTTSTNTDGVISSTVQVNSDAGFSILTYTMGTGNDTVGHGLGVAPDVVITKARQRGDANGFWSVYTTVIDGSLDYLRLNATTAKANSTLAAPTSTVFTGAGSSTVAYRDFVAYCFAEKQGYSKFGTYKATGNGSNDANFIHTGFKPAVIITKSIDLGGWLIIDSARTPINDDSTDRLFPNTTDAEDNFEVYDFLSNGFKLRSPGGIANVSGETFFFMAFAENPFVTSTGVPTTAR